MSLTKEELKDFLNIYKQELINQDYDKIFASLKASNNYCLDEIATFLYKNGVDFLDKIKTIPAKLFRFSDITSIVIPENIEVIGEAAFWSCKNLKTIELKNGLKKIENSAFSGCKNLEEIIIPDTVESIEPFAFYNCKNLKKVHLPVNSKYKIIEYFLFSDDINLEEVNISKYIEKIEENAFYNCGKVKIDKK